jgi:hypothetical protein
MCTVHVRENIYLLFKRMYFLLHDYGHGPGDCHWHEQGHGQEHGQRHGHGHGQGKLSRTPTLTGKWIKALTEILELR